MVKTSFAPLFLLSPPHMCGGVPGNGESSLIAKLALQSGLSCFFEAIHLLHSPPNPLRWVSAGTPVHPFLMSLRYFAYAFRISASVAPGIISR